MRILLLVSLLLVWCLPAVGVTDPALQYRATLVREAQAVYGLNAPIPMFAGQIKQESGWRPGVTAYDGGMGLSQFMQGTVDQIVRSYPELGPPDPYNPKWAIRALVRYDGWIRDRVKGDTVCDKWAASLVGYNGGPGYVQRAQKKSPRPGIWFGATDAIPTGQSEKNFKYSRLYAEWILKKHQLIYKSWGTTTCLEPVS